MWEKNSKDVPSIEPKLSIDSEIIVEPIVNHQIRKKGLRIVKIKPIKTGFLMLNFSLLIP